MIGGVKPWLEKLFFINLFAPTSLKLMTVMMTRASAWETFLHNFIDIHFTEINDDCENTNLGDQPLRLFVHPTYSFLYCLLIIWIFEIN